MIIDISVYGTVGLFSSNMFWRQSDVLINRLGVNNNGVVRMVNTFAHMSKHSASNQPFSGKCAAVLFDAAKRYSKD